MPTCPLRKTQDIVHYLHARKSLREWVEKYPLTFISLKYSKIITRNSANLQSVAAMTKRLNTVRSTHFYKTLQNL